MITEDQTIEQRIVELESAMKIAENHCHFVLVREISTRIDWLRSIQKRQEGAE